MILLLWLACAPLPAYERGLLMTPVMAEVADPFAVHVDRTREAMTGAETAGGASCGCN